MTSAPPRSPRALSTAYVTDLVTNTLDPGYAAATARRRTDPRSTWWDRWNRPMVALGCLLIGFTVAVAWVHTNRSAPAAARVHADLVTRVRAAQQIDGRLAASAGTLAAEANRLRDEALPSDGAVRSQLDRDELLAGVTAVSGPGLVVRLADPPPSSPTPVGGRPGTTPLSETAVLTDRDIRAVVNELWHDGAEAISVNDVRLTTTTAIRFAGQAVLVDFRPVTSPYTIRAIGDRNVLETAFVDSAVASRYQTLAGARGVEFSFDQANQLTLPASAAVAPRYAQPATTPSPTPGPSR
jgi:uncharacterized protein YlxW (UPF0749 family)